MTPRLFGQFPSPGHDPAPPQPTDNTSILLAVAAGIVASLEASEDEDTELLAWAETAVETIESIAVDELFPNRAPNVSAAARADVFATIAGHPEDIVRELIAQHQRCLRTDAQLAALIRPVARGIVYLGARQEAREAARKEERRAVTKAVRSYRKTVAAQLVDDVERAGSARILAETVPQLLDRIEVIKSRRRPR